MNDTQSPDRGADLSEFPELVQLNFSEQGRPVFWFHGAAGGVQPYLAIAAKCNRPFYGIQARGWMTKQEPLAGIEAMAAFYINIIRLVQPEGPYDLGGFSLGGMLAYEVTRQLQELGEAVNTITMIDTLDLTGLTTAPLSVKSAQLSAVNFELSSLFMLPADQMAELWIHSNEVDRSLSEDDFFEELLRLATQRATKIPPERLRKRIRSVLEVQDAYKLQEFSIAPLPDAGAVKCRYFRNKGGFFFGELDPFFTIVSDEFMEDKTNYWSVWEKQLPNFTLVDVEVSNHFMFFTEADALAPIVEFCEGLYS